METTPRITPLEGRNAPLLLRLLNRVMRRVLGQESAPLKVVAHNPAFLLPFMMVSRFVRARTELPAGIRLLATQLVAAINACAWCVDYGRYEGHRQGVPVEKLLAVTEYATSPLFSPAERAALAFAEAATQVGARVPDEVFAELRRHFSVRAIVELTLAVATENFYNRINAPLGIGAQGFCVLPALRVVERRAA